MKTNITFIALFLWAFYTSAQTQQQTMLKIDKDASGIKNNISTYTKIEKNKSSEGDKYVYLDNKELKLVTVKAIDKTFEKNVEWYYINGILTYSETNWIDLTSKKVIKHEKHYLNNGHLIAWLNSENKFIDSTSSEFKNLETDLNSYGTKLKNDALSQ